MSGHSKWANIKKKKGINDEEKGKIFSKLSRLITIAVVEGNNITDPEKNFRLRLVIETAKEHNMPKENITRALDRGLSSEGSNIKELVYEGFAPGGISLVIVTTTDNTNRTFNEVRATLEKHEGKIGAMGSTLYNFEKCGIVMINRTKMSEDEVMGKSEELHAFDMDESDEDYILFIPFDDLGHVKRVLGHIEGLTAEPFYKIVNSIGVTDEEYQKVTHLIDLLEQLDDVQKVYSNVQIH